MRCRLPHDGTVRRRVDTRRRHALLLGVGSRLIELTQRETIVSSASDPRLRCPTKREWQARWNNGGGKRPRQQPTKSSMLRSGKLPTVGVPPGGTAPKAKYIEVASTWDLFAPTDEDIPEESPKGMIGSLGIPTDSKKGMIHSQGICSSSCSADHRDFTLFYHVSVLAFILLHVRIMFLSVCVEE